LPFPDWLRQFAWDRLRKMHRFHIGTQRRSVARERRGPAMPDETAYDLATRFVADGTSPSQGLIREESIRRVRGAIAAMSPADREILSLRHVDQLTMAEIADTLAISEGTAKVRHLRALRRLKVLLEDVP
jgi:RNA polymerase sigma-70 factor (ECF subfamily)